MAENDRFDPMVLESGLRYYQETRETTPLVVRAEADVVEDVLNPPSEALKKRKKWSDEETDLVLEAWDSSRSENEPLWKGVAKAVPGTTELECRRRVETLKKSCNKVKEYCDKEEKGFAELNDADFAKMKLAARITERWYTRIRDHCPDDEQLSFTALLDSFRPPDSAPMSSFFTEDTAPCMSSVDY